MTADVRLAPRATLTDDKQIRLGSRLAVRVVNISLSGVLLETTDAGADIAQGDHLDLTVPLDGSGFSARLQVGRERRLPDGRTGSRLQVGCAFVNLDAARRQQLAEFLADGLTPSGTDVTA